MAWMNKIGCLDRHPIHTDRCKMKFVDEKIDLNYFLNE